MKIFAAMVRPLARTEMDKTCYRRMANAASSCMGDALHKHMPTWSVDVTAPYDEDTKANQTNGKVLGNSRSDLGHSRPGRVSRKSGHIRYALKAEVISEH
jgi:hypothetical protein